MANRKRSKSEKRQRTAAVNFRLRPEFHAQLKFAADERKTVEKDWSLSREIETRLVRSFELEKFKEQIFRNFGGEKTYAVLRTIAEAIKGLETQARFDVGENAPQWFDDSGLHAAVSKMVQLLLVQIRPQGVGRELSTVNPEGVLAGLLTSITIADDGVPIDGADEDGHRVFYSEGYKLMPTLKRRLGSLASRLRPQAIWEKQPTNRPPRKRTQNR